MSNGKPKKVLAFNYKEEGKINLAIAKMYGTIHGMLKETFTVDDYRLLFVRPAHRPALDFVYSIESDFRARGDIFFDITAHSGVISLDTTEGRAQITRCIFQLHWDRSTTPNGFLTTEKLFGTRTSPLDMLQIAPETLRLKFLSNLVLLAKTCGEWVLVKWVFEVLNKSLRTPQQMRYVWPAIYPLSSAAELEMDLSSPSSRAAVNAVPRQDVRAYLRDSNDVVARMALIGGTNKEWLEAGSKNDLKIAYLALQLENQTLEFTQG